MLRVRIDSEPNTTPATMAPCASKYGLPKWIMQYGTIMTKIAFAPNGTISNPLTGQTFGQVALAVIPRQEALMPVGKGLYQDRAEQRTTQAGDGVQQGYLEGSNVDSLQELVQMITVERSFTATQKALTGIGRLQENLITNILR